MTTILDAVILRANEDVSVGELQAIATGTNNADFRPALAVGEPGIGSPAYGYAQNLRVLGDKLIADLADVPDAIADAIRTGAAQAIVSVYNNARRAGRKLHRAIKVIVLTGIPTPRLRLVPSGVVEFRDGDGAVFRLYSELGVEAEQPGNTVDRMVKELRAESPTVSYSAALRAVLATNRKLADEYGGIRDYPDQK